MTPHALRFALLAALPLAAVSAACADEKPYTPIAAEIGAGGPPPADLVERAKAVADAVAAGSEEEVFAFVADRPTIVMGGISLGAARRVEKKGPFANARSALAEIGLAYTEGEPVLPNGKTADMTASRARTAMATIGERIGAARWARDPLVPGAWCTERGVRWDAKAAKNAGLGDNRGAYFTEKISARAAPNGKSKVVGSVTAGLVYRLEPTDEENGFVSIVLPTGKTGWVPWEKVGDPTIWSVCFEKGQAGWILTTFVSALL